MSIPQSIILSPQTAVMAAIKTMHAAGTKCVFIVSEDNTLLGLFTDGDMRRYILSGNSLTACIADAMNCSPKVYVQDTEKTLQEFIKHDKLIVYPIVDKENHLLNAVFWNEETTPHSIKASLPSSVPVVIMAGGLGTRLYPYTKILPKALVPIGDMPICSHIIQSFREAGCNDFHLIVNHKKNIIKAYYGDIEKDYALSFHDEKEFLGTGGGLYLLKDMLQETFFLSNCDILVEADFYCAYAHHKESNNIATIIAAVKDVTIPYGIIHINEDKSLRLQEKPSFSFLTNIGIYIIEPRIFEYMKENEYIHMPDILQRCMDNGERVGTFPVSGDAWLDMGEMNEMKKMQVALEQKCQRKG